MMNLHPLKAAMLVAGLATPLASHALSASIDDLAGFLGTTPAALEAVNPMSGLVDERELPGIMIQGVAIKQSITVTAGSTLSFDWFFGTDEGSLGAGNGVLDFALFTVNGTPTRLASVGDPLEPASSTAFLEQLQAADNADGTDSESNNAVTEAYFRTQRITFDEAGTYTLGFAVIDVVDTAVRSTLVVDQVRLGGALIGNGGFEDFGDPSDPVFELWQVLGDVSTWSEAPGVTEGNYGVALVSANAGAPVPLPAGVWLLGSAIGVLGWQRRRRS